MTGRALTRALVAALVTLAAVCVFLVVDAMEGREPTGQPAPTGTTAPRPLP